MNAEALERQYAGRLTNACIARDLAEATLKRIVIEARRDGVTWRAIGDGLGVSAQAAHQRYRWIVRLAEKEAAA